MVYFNPQPRRAASAGAGRTVCFLLPLSRCQTANSGDLHPDKIDEGNSNFFGLDPENDVHARDDIVSGSWPFP